MYLFIDEFNIIHSSRIVGIFKTSAFKIKETTSSSLKLPRSVILLTDNQRILSPIRPTTLYQRIQKQIKTMIEEMF